MMWTDKTTNLDGYKVSNVFYKTGSAGTLTTDIA